MRRALACLLAVLASGPAHAGTVGLALTGVGYDVPARLEDDVRAALDKVVAFDEQVLGLRLPDRVDLAVKVYADRAAYDRDAVAHGHAPGETIGFFHGRDGGAVWRNTDVEQLRGTLVHEASHHLLALGGARPPMWLNEGLAELFERFRVSGNAVWAEPDAGVVDWLHGLGGDVPTLAELVSADASFWSSRQGPLGKAWYSYGWALVAFLASTDHGQATLAALVRSPGVGTLDARWPGGLVAAETAWRRWASGSPRALVLSDTASRASEVRPTSATDPCPGGVLLRKGDQDVCVR